MIALFVIAGLTFGCFVAVIFVGAPYLPTLSPQVKVALELSGLKKGDTLIELGSGDGKVLLAAAKKGIKSVGYELNPVLVIISRLRTLKYRSSVRIIWGDFWKKDWPEANAIFTFLLPKYMNKLDTKISGYPHKPTRLVSFAFEIEGKKATTTKNGVFRYDYK